ncbi:MAG: class I SAM-dependent methyltransferase [Deltaproteobacteria bacterium]|nr:class I SAM-dependent methyltransferase [Deltaproteobacteria bacterium]
MKDHDPWADYIRQTSTAAADNEVMEFVRDGLTRASHPRALDLGCGGGRHLAYLHGLGCRAVGIDRSPAARAASLFPVLIQDLCDPLPVRSGCIDLALLWGTLVHLPPAAQRPVLEEIARVLVPGGRLLVDFLRPDDFRRALGHPITENFRHSPWLAGVTDHFCRAAEVAALCDSLLVVREGDCSLITRDGQRVSQGYLWLQKSAPAP